VRGFDCSTTSSTIPARTRLYLGARQETGKCAFVYTTVRLAADEAITLFLPVFEVHDPKQNRFVAVSSFGSKETFQRICSLVTSSIATSAALCGS
jgi:hypothetical protein